LLVVGTASDAPLLSVGFNGFPITAVSESKTLWFVPIDSSQSQFCNPVTNPAEACAVTLYFNGFSHVHAVFATLLVGATSLDVSSSGSGNSVSPFDPPTLQTISSTEVFVSALSTIGPVTDQPGIWQNGWVTGQRAGTMGGSVTNNSTVQEGYKQTNTQEQSQAALTGITSRNWTIVHGAFK
jgi:hypothetical protein